MKQGIEDLKEREKIKEGGARDKTAESERTARKITEDDWVKVRRRKLENGRQIMKKTDGESEENEAESN